MSWNIYEKKVDQTGFEPKQTPEIPGHLFVHSVIKTYEEFVEENSRIGTKCSIALRKKLKAENRNKMNWKNLFLK